MLTGIVLLAADIEQNNEGKWCSAEKDHSGIVHGFWRVMATGILYKKGISDQIIVTGGYPPNFKQQDTVRPTIASVVREELIEVGVPEKSILIEDRARNTYEQIKNTTRIALSKNIVKLFYVTHEWAIPRVSAMLQHLLDVSTRLEISFVPAEETILSVRPDWRERIEQIRVDPETSARIRLEQQGIKDILGGRYKITK